jgi:hypothetical protein
MNIAVIDYIILTLTFIINDNHYFIICSTIKGVFNKAQRYCVLMEIF